MSDAMKSVIGKASRRLTVAAAGALGFSASQIDSSAGQVVVSIVAFALLMAAEYFSSRHDTKIIERAIEATLKDTNTL